VQALLPEVDPATRTRRARLELANANGALVPGMTVQMRFMRQMAQPTLLVPSDAVIHTGRRSVVLLAEDQGRFRPVEVRTGLEAGGQTEIVQGLQAGQQVVRSGQFLIDSEASLRGVEARLNQEPAAAAANVATHRTDAVVKSVDADSVTLDHPPIESLKWPQMVMDFRLPPADQRPRGLAAGQRVQVEFRIQDGDVPQIVTLQRLAPAASGAAR
jgi:Cu(I)/Ag(I) efflux system membrane fusion protein